MPSQGGAFLPQIGSCMMSLTTVASVPISPSSAGGVQGARMTNITTDNAYIWIGSSAIVPTSNTTAAPFLSMPLLQKTSLVISCPPNSFFSGLTTAAGITATVVITAGYGIP